MEKLIKNKTPSEMVEQMRNSLAIKVAKCLLCKNESKCYADREEFIYEALNDTLFQIERLVKLLSLFGIDCGDFESMAERKKLTELAKIDLEIKESPALTWFWNMLRIQIQRINKLEGDCKK